MGATPDVRAPAGHGLAHDSQPAGQVTAVVQSETDVAATTAAEVTSGAHVDSTAAETTGVSEATATDGDHMPLFWGRAVAVWKREREMRESMA